ncbi:MAG: hypothetical protein WCK42_06800 [Myxococcaceae bacterium]
MNLIQMTTALELGLLFSLVSLGVYLSFRVLQFPDLTVDGSFSLGAAVFVICVSRGLHPGIALFLSALAGALAGLLTAILSTRLKILNLMAGILVMIALYSINIRILGGPNLALATIGDTNLLELLLLVAGVFGVVFWFLSTQIGLALRATGENPRMARAQGINESSMIHLGLSLSNALVALAGALFAQIQGFADVSMGIGMIVLGLVSIVIGEALLSPRTVLRGLIGCLLGAVIYRFLVAFALNSHVIHLEASDLNLVTAILIILAMVVKR